jgi:hypothetical protein
MNVRPRSPPPHHLSSSSSHLHYSSEAPGNVNGSLNRSPPERYNSRGNMDSDFNSDRHLRREKLGVEDRPLP